MKLVYLTATLHLFSKFAQAQRGASGAEAAGPLPILQAAPPLALSQLATPVGESSASGAVYNNRSIATQHVLAPGGCMISTITGADAVCLQDATFKVDAISIARPADYKADNLANGFNSANYAANNSACAAAKPTVTTLYEKTGCVLSEAVNSTTGLSSTQIPDAYVCESSGSDTTSFDATYPAEVCRAATQLAARALRSGAAVSSSGNPCTASRATYIVSNPCRAQNTSVNTTARFFLATDTADAPGPAPGPESAAALAPGPDMIAMAPAADNPSAPGAAGAEGAASPSPAASSPGPDGGGPAAAAGPQSAAASTPPNTPTKPAAAPSAASHMAPVASCLSGTVFVLVMASLL